MSAIAVLAISAAPVQRVDRPVGLRVLGRLDVARTSKRFPKGRPVQIAIWYPAVASGPPLAYSDYVLLTATEKSLGNSPVPDPAVAAKTLGEYRAFLGKAKVSRANADAWLATKMRAARGAAPAPGKASLVVIAQGNGESAADQAFLAERLAERGYVVVTTPSQARIGGAMKSESDIPAQAEDQAADLAFAITAVRADPQVAPGKYGLVAHSFGARSALLLAMRDENAAALVSLDGGIGAKTGKGLLEKAKGFDRSRAKAPILHLWEEGDRFMQPDLDLLRSLSRSDRWLVKVDDMRHVHFSSMGILARAVPAIAEITSATANTASAWDAVAEATGSFLDRFLRGAGSGPESARWAPPPSPRLHTVFLSRS